MKNLIVLLVATAALTACSKSAPSNDVGADSESTFSNSVCDPTYQRVRAACFTGRAQGFELPLNAVFGATAGDLTQSWNFGSYTSVFKGPAFTPAGFDFDKATSILPPYSWGAVGQICDDDFDPAIHAACVERVKQDLADATKNAESSLGEFYWKAHGHNCHDAADDVGHCINQAAPYAKSSCDLSARVIVWDWEPDVTKALGNVYHSQLLVKQTRENPATHSFEPVVCLEESQSRNPAGQTDPACCSTKASLFDGGTIEEYVAAFGSCQMLFFEDSVIHPHVYEVANLRDRRQTGAMDVESSYDRKAGIKALQSSAPLWAANFATKPPKLVGRVYDSHGVLKMFSVK